MLIYLLVVFFLLSAVKSDERSGRVRRIVGGSKADLPPVDDPVIYSRFNGRSAKVQGVRDFPHFVFRGIRYAHPPIGRDRFIRPREKFLEGTVNATEYPPPCVQPVPGRNKVIGKEDCLALNIFTPELPTGMEGLPVVIWIHGGGFRYGSASQYGVRHLVGRRLVVVTIQYRLGSLGFLSTGTKEMPGNAALWDMALAVQWTRNYIGFFGGNPHRIVVMGHDTGASSALILALSNIAKGIPSGVVAMSGTAVSQWAIDSTPANTARDVAQENGCPTTSTLTMVKCLQKIPPDSVIRSDSTLEFRKLQQNGFVSGLGGRLGAAPVSEGCNDGRSLPSLVEDDPMNDMYKEKNPRVPLLTGVTKDETKKAVEGHFKSDVINKLRTIPDFLDKILVNSLKKAIGIRSILTHRNVSEQDSLGLNFRNYLQVEKNSLTEGLHKVSEATADVLFNLPAFLTAQLWKGAPTYLYSFQHSGNLKKGFSFLQGMPFMGNNTPGEELNDTVGHGDDLAYLFEPQDLEGNPLESDDPTDDDLNVREFFTQMIADFARHGKIHVDNKEVLPFSNEKNNFIQIKAKPVLADNFRFCQMALWTNVGNRLKSGACDFLKAFDIPVDGVQPLFDTLSNIPKTGLGNGEKTGIPSVLNTNGKIPNIFGSVNADKSSKNNGDVLEKSVIKKSPLGSIFG